MVVICHDLGRFLEEALASVLAQTRPPDELLVVDDGSDDPYTRQVLERVAFRGIRQVRTANRGLSAARNVGARSTTAELLVFLDADDRLEPGYLAALSEHLARHPGIDVVSCAMKTFGEEDGVWTPEPPQFARSIAHGVIHASSMLRRPVLAALGGFDETIPAFEDLDFWTRFVRAGFRGEVLPEPLLRYRIRPDSMWRTAIRAGHHLAHMEAFYRRHLEDVSAQFENVYVEKEAMLLGQRAHREHLLERQRQEDAARQHVEERIREAQVALAALGEPVVDFGDLARATPLSDDWGLERGQPADRLFIEAFLAAHALDVRGHVLEVQDPDYAQGIGGSRVTRVDVVDIDGGNPRATIVADLTTAGALPADAFDCVILTQTLQYLRDVPAAIAGVHRALRPGGVLLCTVPAVGPLLHEGRGHDGDYWRFTEAALRELLGPLFPPDAYAVTAYGNAPTAAAVLYGLASHEVPEGLSATPDAAIPVIYGVRAVKLEPLRWGAPTAARPRILMFHRVADETHDPHRLCVPTARFRDQMQRLAQQARVMPLAELAQSMADGTAPEGAVAITFDDGYLDNLTSAAPILAELGLPATFFVTSLQDGEPWWWDALAELEPDRERHDALWGRLVRLPPGERAREIARLREGRPATRALPRRMTGDELRRLAAQPGVTIGAHSHSHALLPSLDDAALREEVRRPRQELEALLGRPVTLFAYPFGAHDERVVRAVREAGYVTAVTTVERVVEPGVHPLMLPRLPGDNAGDA